MIERGMLKLRVIILSGRNELTRGRDEDVL